MNDKSINVLLVEDSPGDTRLLQEMLAEARGASFELEHTQRLTTGLEKLTAGDIDVILLDLSLPDSQGFDTFAQMHAQAPQMPIIVLTGLDDEALALKAVREGAQDYLVKGQVDSNLLARAIRYAIERKQTEVRQAYYLQAEQVLRRISSRFVNMQNLDQAINEMLRDTGTVLRASRAYLFRLHDGANNTNMSNTHEWVAEGSTPHMKDWQAVETKDFPWWMNKLYSNEIITISDVNELPSPEKQMLEGAGILSTLDIPIFTHGDLYGFLGFDETEQRREWKTEEIGFLRNTAEILGRAIERTQAEQFLQQRNLELATFNAVIQALSASLELKDLLDEALSRIVYALGFAGGLINLAGERTGNLTLSSYKGLPPSLIEHLKAHGLGGTLCDSVYREGKPLALQDLSESARADVRMMLETGLRSYVGTPITHKGHILGTLCLFDIAPHPISETDLALLAAIGRQIGVAVENARLFRDVAREREVAHTLLDTAEALSTTLQLDRLLERVLDELQRVIPYVRASINLLHDERCWTVASRGPEHAGSRRTGLKEFPLVQRVVHECSPVIVPEVHKEPDWVPIEGLEAVHSWMGVPLISKDKVIGVLMVDSDRSDIYDEEMARLAAAFAHQVALAIDSSRLYEQTRAQLREAALLHEVMTALSSTLDVDQILPYVTRSLCEILNSTGAEVYSLNEEAGTVTVIADYVASGATELEQPSSLGRTHALAALPAVAEALTQRRPLQVRVDDPEADPSERARLESRGAQAALLLPMMARDRVLGFAQVWDSQSPRRFTAGEIAVGQTLIHPAAIAMENALLFEKTRKQVRRTELWLGASKAAASTLDTIEVLRRVARAVAKAIGADTAGAYLLDESGTALQPIAGYRVPPERIETYRKSCIPLKGHAFVEEAWQSQQLLYTSDAANDLRFDERMRQLFPATSVLLIPMIVRDETIGSLWAVWWEEAHRFAEEELQLTEGIVRQAAVAIQNASLFEQVETARIELQQRAEALEEANVRLRELDRLKSDFLASTSHELRTPLNSIIGFSEVLVDGLLGKMSPEQYECVENILQSGEHLLALINDILDLSKIEAGRLTLEPTTFDVGTWLTGVQATITSLIEKKSQILKIELPDALPPLTADRFRIKQVLLNLLGNAVKFTPNGGDITLACRLADADTVLFSVTDTGVGIKPEDQEIIFEEFRQAGDMLAREAGGTGLGLTISKRLVEIHGGSIWVESEYGHGATFSFLLPVNGPPVQRPQATGDTAQE
jgi:GAF domain-containing protein/CheY-like chemotaxis protein